VFPTERRSSYRSGLLRQASVAKMHSHRTHSAVFFFFYPELAHCSFGAHHSALPCGRGEKKKAEMRTDFGPAPEGGSKGKEVLEALIRDVRFQFLEMPTRKYLRVVNLRRPGATPGDRRGSSKLNGSSELPSFLVGIAVTGRLLIQSDFAIRLTSLDVEMTIL